MARKPSEPSPKPTGSKSVGRSAEQRASATGAQIAGEVQVAGGVQAAGERSGQIEAVGPLVVTRLRKADGGALILYSAAGERT